MGVRANSDGSGVVQAGVGLDRDASGQIPDLAAQLRVDDLRRAGWVITGPRQEKDKLTWVRAARRFSSPSDAARAMDELNGPGGPFQNFRLERHRSLLHTTTRFTGTVDLSGGVGGFQEDELRRRLGGADLGLDPQLLERRLGVVLNRVFRVQVSADLPGSISSNAPAPADRGVVWRPKLGERARLQATAKAWNGRTVGFGILAVLAAVAAVVVVVVRRR